MATQPTVKWAQRKDRLFLTVDIQDIEEETVALTAEKVLIKGKVRPHLPPSRPSARRFARTHRMFRLSRATMLAEWRHGLRCRHRVHEAGRPG